MPTTKKKTKTATLLLEEFIRELRRKCSPEGYVSFTGKVWEFSWPAFNILYNEHERLLRVLKGYEPPRDEQDARRLLKELKYKLKDICEPGGNFL